MTQVNFPQITKEEAFEVLPDLFKKNPLAAEQFSNLVLLRRLAEVQRALVAATERADGVAPVQEVAVSA